MAYPLLVAKPPCPLLPPPPPKNVGVRKGGLGGKKLLGKRVRIKNLLNILWEEDILGPPKLRVYRDSRRSIATPQDSMQ